MTAELSQVQPPECRRGGYPGDDHVEPASIPTLFQDDTRCHEDIVGAGSNDILNHSQLLTDDFALADG